MTSAANIAGWLIAYVSCAVFGVVFYGSLGGLVGTALDYFAGTSHWYAPAIGGALYGFVFATYVTAKAATKRFEVK